VGRELAKMLLYRPRFRHPEKVAKPLIQIAQYMLLMIGRSIRRAMQTNDCTWPAAPRVPNGDIRYEIMRIEARRRI
jgi:hypothetical protein